ncbi:MAG TPA: hypothetical protein HPP51_03580 [Planctomycetes bacterium]|nr:hypothetical protein [Planctomycetota bacterium]
MRGYLVVVSCVALAVFFGPGSNDARSAEGKESKQVTCTGKIVDKQDRPIADAKVKLYKVAVETVGVSFKMELAQQAVTGADGTFTLNSEVIEEQYSNQAIILADKEALAFGWDNWRLDKDADVEITLGPAEVLAGIVVDENGEPIDNAEVGIPFMLAPNGGQPRYLVGYMSLEFLSTKSDSEGKFSFDRIPAEATAEFVVKKPGRATVSTFNPEDFQGQSLQFSTGQTGIKIVQPLGAKIEGVVVEKTSGKPAGGVRIMALRGRNQPNFGNEPVISKEDGSFSFDCLAPGEHMVQVVTSRDQESDWISEPVEVSTKAGKTTSDVKVELTRGGVLEVLVTDSITKKPVEKATVSIMPAGGGTGSGKSTDQDGMARFRQMPGEYRISYLHKEGYSRHRQQEDTITIEDDKTIRVDIQLAGLPKITGVVSDERGRPVEGAKLKVCPMGSSAESCISDAEGKFEANWDPGNWHSSETPAMVLIARQTERNLAAAVDVDENTHQIDIKLKPGVICTGKVVASDGKGIPSARLLTMLQGPRWGSSIGRYLTADDEGNYEIKALTPERMYSIQASAEGYGRDRIVVEAGQAVDNRFDAETISLLAANLSVSGVVVDSNDKPVSSVSVSCYGEIQPRNQSQKTDAEGKFKLENICAGRVRISANKGGDKHLYGSVETDGGTADIKIVISERPSSTRYEPKRPPSLIGRPLPELKNVGIDLPPADTDGRIMLVCLFDMEQRPSRHCVTQLAKRAEQLKGKGVTIVAIQASKMDQDTLSEWKNKYNIPFPIGMVRSDTEKTRFTWGIRSLPWLILTDQKHIVEASGFSLAKLDEKI